MPTPAKNKEIIGASINQRYKIRSLLGQGGMGTVYRAHDQTLERDVALKLLSNTRMGTEGRARMLHEAKTVANLNHPNIVTVFDAGEYEQSPYIVMELVEGVTLHDARPENLEDTLRVIKQICTALEHAHQNGVIHRDLKPENVVISTDGTAKLMDFGLARSVASRMTREGTIMGTVFYMAPEQAMGADIDPRADLYALGVMLYEFTTGQLPFEGEGAIAVITQHINAPVVPPRAKVSDLPPKLNDLILSLLAKDREDRPESASALLAMFQDPQLLDQQAAAEDEIPTLDRIVRGRIVGRQQEFEQARELWNQTMAEQGQTLLISGEPGIGKSRLTREIITHAEVSGGRVLFGAAYEEGGAPYAIFRQMLRAALRDTEIKKLSIPASVLSALLNLVPDLRDSYPEISLDDDAVLDQIELFEHFTVFTNLISSQTPLLLVLDDVHWADSGSLALMRHLARQTRAGKVMVLATYREVELDEARPFHEVLLDLTREQIGTRIKLLRLDREQTRQMLASLLAEEITDDFLEGIYRETEGNPFFIEEVCKALVDSGKMYFEDGEWHRPSIAELGIPQGVKVAIQSRISKLPEDVQEIISQAAVIGREFGYETLLDASGVDEDSLTNALEEAEKSQLIAEIKGPEAANFQFVHALIPTSLVESIRTLKRRKMYRRAAEAVEGRNPDKIEVLAQYYLESGEAEKAGEYLLRVGDRARLAYANQEAAEAYLQAIDFLKDKEDYENAANTLMKLGLVYSNMFNFEASNRAQQEAFELWQQTSDLHESNLEEKYRHLRVVFPMNIFTFNPNKVEDQFSFYISLYLFNRLVTTSADANILPDIAKSWQVLDEGMRYVFNLREDVYWSDGVQVTAEDFVFSYQDRSSKLGVKALDPFKLEFTLPEPVGDFLYSLAAFGFAVPKHVVEKHGDDWAAPDTIVTNGMYTIQEYQPGKKIILKRNFNYHIKTGSNLDTIELDLGTEIVEAIEKFSRDEVDLVTSHGISAESFKLVKSLGLRDKLYSAPILSTLYIKLNTNEAPFNDPRVRQAMVMAVDLEGYKSPDQFGFEIARGGLIPPGMVGYSPGINLKYDPEAARKLLAEAGFLDGGGFPKIKAMKTEWGHYGDLNYFSKSWQEILNIQIDWQDVALSEILDFLSNLGSPDWNMYMMGWFADTLDPRNMLDQSGWYKEPGEVKWEHEEFYQLIKAARSALKQEERIKLYQQADKIVAEQVPIICFAHMQSVNLIKPWVKGLPLSASTAFELRYIRIEDH